MNVYYGDLKDSKNLESTSYLQLNSCGSSSTLENEYLVIRSGRSDYHIFYVAEGEAEIYENETSHRLKKGDFVLYPPKAPQKYKRLRGTRDFWIHFNGFQVTEIINDAGLSLGVNRATESEEIKTLFERLITEHSINGDKKANTEKGVLLTILYTLGRLTSEISAQRQNEWIRKAVLYINEHYAESFSNSFLASMCNLSLGRFEHIFKAELTVSPSAYRQRLRIENAKSLLSSTTLSVFEISELVGFADQLYFSRIFKNKTGLSPIEYRRTHVKQI